METSNILTIIITASHDNSHPSIDLIKNTIESLDLANIPNNCKILLAHNYDDKIEYIEYLKNLHAYIEKKTNIEIAFRETDSSGKLVGNIKNALQYVNTKFMLLIHHNKPFIQSLDIQKVIEDMEENSNIKHVRFNKRENIRKGFDNSDLFGLQVKQRNYTYTRTPGWSDQNHLCLTSYYRDVVMKECCDGNTFKVDYMEHTLHGRSKDEESHNIYGTYLFGELNHSPVISVLKIKNNKFVPKSK